MPIEAPPQEGAGKFVSPATRSNEVYEELRGQIVGGVLRPNERLVETELAERLNTSRTPIRESLQRLATEGLIRRNRGGWVVYEHTIEEIREIYETRLALEGYAAHLAAERASEQQLAEIATRFRYYLTPDSVGHTSTRFLVDHNREFHDAVTVASGNRRLIDLIRRTWEYAFNEQIARLYSHEQYRASHEDHRRLMEALSRRDAVAAEQVARQHVRDALAIILERL